MFGNNKSNANNRKNISNICKRRNDFNERATAYAWERYGLPVVVSVAIAESGQVGNLVFTEEDKDSALYIGVYLIALSPLMWIVGPSLHRPPKFLEGQPERDGGCHDKKAKESDGNLNSNDTNSDLEEDSDNYNEDDYDDDLPKEKWNYSDSRRLVLNHQRTDPKTVANNIRRVLLGLEEEGRRSELNTNSDLE